MNSIGIHATFILNNYVYNSFCMKSKWDEVVFRIDIDEDLKFSLNKVWGWCHFSVRSRFRNNWHDVINELVDDKKIKPIKDYVVIGYKFFFKTRYLDSSNCSAMAKMIEDWLVEAWIFGWDTNDYVKGIYLESVKIDDKERKKMKNDYVIITIKLLKDYEQKV